MICVLASLAASGLATLLIVTSAEGNSSYRVDAIFDDARGLIPGQLVKIAGARVGTISAVGVTDNFKARIQMSVDGRFAPFRADAACTIEPEGLIAENFVSCSPGTSAGAPLQSAGGAAPTVPLDRNSEPVSITDLFNVWNTPTRDRVAVLVNGLGAGLTGQGDALNSVLYRANPALRLARRAITLVNRQKADLQQIITATDPIVAQLAQHSPAVEKFLTSAASVTQTAANHRSPLAQAINHLPPLLRAARPALRQLDALAAAGGPILSDVHAAAPNINRAIGDVGPFTAAAVPALGKIGPALANTTGVFNQAAPEVHALRTFAAAVNHPAQQLDQLAISMRSRGVVDNLLGFAYDAAGFLARFDSVSHLAIANVVAPPAGCINYADTPVQGCSAWYPNEAQRFATVHARHRRPAPTGATPNPGASAPGAASAPNAAPRIPNLLGGVPGALQGLVQQAQNLVGGLLGKTLTGIGQPGQPGATPAQPSSMRSLLDYLLGR
jgi:virulence factor Mce-like protein